jgi:hypothetical protein
MLKYNIVKSSLYVVGTKFYFLSFSLDFWVYWNWLCLQVAEINSPLFFLRYKGRLGNVSLFTVNIDLDQAS